MKQDDVFYSYLPHTEEDTAAMLKTVGAADIQELFSDIPQHVRLSETLRIPKGISEFETEEFFRSTAGRNRSAVSFLGCGIYDHIIPAAVSAAAADPAFVTSYTPYQPEISQGMLQAIFEFQTLICELTGLDVSNASLYDGHTAAAEAVSMAFQVKRRKKRVLVSSAVHPYTRVLLRTYFSDDAFTLDTIPSESGKTDFSRLKSLLGDDTAAVLVQTPNIFGTLEDLSGIAETVHDADALLIQSSNPMSFGGVKTPAEWGADIAVGDTQVFGLPQYCGGPAAGYIAADKKMLRKMPGRIVGETTDGSGRRVFVLTLQAREQHIKRERATSNICTNQALAALTSSVYLSLVGPAGLEDVFRLCSRKAHYLYSRLKHETRADLLTAPFFNEFTLQLGEKAQPFLDFMLEKGIFGGVHLGDLDPALTGSVTAAVTEKRTKEEIDRYADAAKEFLA